MSKLRSEAKADVLIAEPVGSCTDLSATIIQPLRELHRGEVDVAPLSVLTDPNRLQDILDGGLGGLHPSAAYIFRKQMEEADILVISKSDLIEPAQLEDLKARVAKELPLASVFCISAKTGDGLEVWLAEVMARTDAGRQLAEVDYDIYAEGEAVLGWLNATFALRGAEVNWLSFAEEFLNGLSKRFDTANASVGHVKLIIDADGQNIVGNLTGRKETVSVRGSTLVGTNCRLTLNARVEMPPETVEAIVQEVLALSTDGRIHTTTLAWRCLSPGRPMPTYRYDRLIALS